MDKVDFLSQLSRNLANLPKEEIENALNYYEEYFSEAGKENEKYVIKELGSPTKVASQIIANYTINDSSYSPKSIKRGLLNIKLTFKSLFVSSVAFPISIFIAIFAITLIVSMAVLIISLLAGSIFLVTAGIGIIFQGLTVFTWIFENTILHMINHIGMGIMIVGLGICTFSIFLVVAKNGFSWVAKFVNKILLRRDKND